MSEPKYTVGLIDATDVPISAGRPRIRLYADVLEMIGKIHVGVAVRLIADETVRGRLVSAIRRWVRRGLVRRVTLRQDATAIYVTLRDTHDPPAKKNAAGGRPVLMSTRKRRTAARTAN